MWQKAGGMFGVLTGLFSPEVQLTPSRARAVPFWQTHSFT